MKNNHFMKSRYTSIQKAVALPFIAGLSLNVCAETFNYPIELGTLTLEDGITNSAYIDVQQQFDEIESVCIKAKIESSTAYNVSLTYFSAELIGDLDYIPPPYIIPFAYNLEFPEPGSPPVVVGPKDFSLCNDGLKTSFVENGSEFTITAATGFVELSEINLEVKGKLSDTQTSINLAYGQEPTISADGGFFGFKNSVQNIDSNIMFKALNQWSMLKLPNGDFYPATQPMDIFTYSDFKHEYQHYFNVPAWFEAGEYELHLHVADPLTGKVVKEKLTFSKLEQ